MRLGLVTVVVAVTWALAGNRGLDPRVPRVRWGLVGLAGLLGQLALDRLAPVGEVQVAAEVLSLSALLATCIVNAALPGMVAITAGVAANALAIVLNAGMPVDADAVRALGGDPATLPMAGHHHLLDEATRLPVLADTVGLDWLDVVVSPGDALLVVGAVVALSSFLVGDVPVRPRRNLPSSMPPHGA